MRLVNAAVLAVLLSAPACGRDEPPPVEPAPAQPAPLMTGAFPGDEIPAFTATVRRGGATAPFDSHATAATTVYIVNSTTCPYCAGYAERMKAIETTYLAKGVDVVHVYPNRREPTAEKIAWHAEKGFRGGQIVDEDASIAHLLAAEKTPTVYVVDRGGRIVYRGAIDDSASGDGVTTRYLAQALDAQLAGSPVPEATTEPEG